MADPSSISTFVANTKQDVKEIQNIVAAGATQGNATAITKATVVVSVSASTQGIRLPAPANQQITVFGRQTVGVLVYPQVGGTIYGAAQNAAVLLPAGDSYIYQAVSATTWRVLRGT